MNLHLNNFKSILNVKKLEMSTRFHFFAVFILLVCTRIKWSQGAYISSNSYADKSAYNYGPNLERDFRDTPAFKVQQSYVPDEEDKRGEEDPTVERTTLRAGKSQPESSSNNQLFVA